MLSSQQSSRALMSPRQHLPPVTLGILLVISCGLLQCANGMLLFPFLQSATISIQCIYLFSNPLWTFCD